ncbi:VWA domain-containing protein [Oligoflexia bacterium]|nr:VWA domain-containing protein [Oligoflexia bacterium]
MTIFRFRPVALHFIYSFLFCVLVACSIAQAQTEIEFILDASGSMQEVLDGESRFDSARSALLGAINVLPNEVNYAIRVYGHRLGQNSKERSCKDTELLVPFRSVTEVTTTASSIQSKLSNLNSRGYTSLANSLLAAKRDFSNRGGKKVVILLSDGEETCGGDPVEAIAALRRAGFTVRIYAIGFKVNAVARKQLEEVARKSGGAYFSAPDAAILPGAMSDAVFSAIADVKGLSTAQLRGDLGTRVDAGYLMGGALSVAPGKHAGNFLGLQDRTDIFALKAKVGEKFYVAVVPDSSSQAILRMRVLTRSQEVLFDGVGTAGQKLRSEVISMSEVGKLYIELSQKNFSAQPFSYSLEIEQLVSY